MISHKVQHKLRRNEQNRLPHDQIAHEVENLRPREAARFPRIGEGAPQVDLLGALRTHVLLADNQPAPDQVNVGCSRQ